MGDDLSLDEMAQSIGLSTAHFARAFRKSRGESPYQFVLRQRVARATAMLRAPDARVLDVAVACGFKTQQHFAQVFRDVCGVSPTEYRQDFLDSEVISFEVSDIGDCARITCFSVKWLSREIRTIPIHSQLVRNRRLAD
jgi:AraC-like DNA-binding protein